MGRFLVVMRGVAGLIHTTTKGLLEGSLDQEAHYKEGIRCQGPGTGLPQVIAGLCGARLCRKLFARRLGVRMLRLMSKSSVQILGQSIFESVAHVIRSR